MNIPSAVSAVTVKATLVLHLAGAAAAAFPLFDPVHESKWDPSWKPELTSTSIAEGLVFFTDDERGRATWLLDSYEPGALQIRYVVFSQTVLDRIDIALKPDGTNRSIARVTYTRTALDPAADEQVRRFGYTFPSQAPHWEAAINGVLRAAQ